MEDDKKQSGGANPTPIAIAAFSLLLAVAVAGKADVSRADVLDLVRLDGSGESAELQVADAATVGRLATVRVAGRNCDGVIIGSGFHANGVLLTNRHLVVDAVDAKIDQPVRPVFRSVVRRSAELDLVAIDPVLDSELVLAEQDASIGDTVFLAGHGGGGETQILEGRVHLLAQGSSYGVAGLALLIDGRTTGGFSGGPVLNERAEVVGILQGYEPLLDLTIATPVSSIRLWLEAGTDAPQPAPCNQTNTQSE